MVETRLGGLTETIATDIWLVYLVRHMSSILGNSIVCRNLYHGTETRHFDATRPEFGIFSRQSQRTFLKPSDFGQPP